MFSRSMRAETRSKTKEDLKKVHKSTTQARNWEKKWVAVKDTSMLVFKWVPSLNVDNAHAKRAQYLRQANLSSVHNTGPGLLSSFGPRTAKPAVETLSSTEVPNHSDLSSSQKENIDSEFTNTPTKECEESGKSSENDSNSAITPSEVERESSNESNNHAMTDD